MVLAIPVELAVEEFGTAFHIDSPEGKGQLDIDVAYFMQDLGSSLLQRVKPAAGHGSTAQGEVGFQTADRLYGMV